MASPHPQTGQFWAGMMAPTQNPSTSDVQGPLLDSPSHLQAEWDEGASTDLPRVLSSMDLLGSDLQCSALSCGVVSTPGTRGPCWWDASRAPLQLLSQSLVGAT